MCGCDSVAGTQCSCTASQLLDLSGAGPLVYKMCGGISTAWRTSVRAGLGPRAQLRARCSLGSAAEGHRDLASSSVLPHRSL